MERLPFQATLNSSGVGSTLRFCSQATCPRQLLFKVPRMSCLFLCIQLVLFTYGARTAWFIVIFLGRAKMITRILLAWLCYETQLALGSSIERLVEAMRVVCANHPGN